MNTQALKKVGLKITTPRLRILHLFENTNLRHLSAEAIYQSLLCSGGEVGLATIYRVLTQFEAAGLIKRHRFSHDQSVFELNQGTHHDHLVCVECMQVEEFMDDLIETRQLEIAQRAGYVITDHALTIYGVCQRCKG